MTPVAAGTFTITAAVSETDTYKADSKTSETVTINTLQSPNLMTHRLATGDPGAHPNP